MRGHVDLASFEEELYGSRLPSVGYSEATSSGLSTCAGPAPSMISRSHTHTNRGAGLRLLPRIWLPPQSRWRRSRRDQEAVLPTQYRSRGHNKSLCAARDREPKAKGELDAPSGWLTKARQKI